MSISMQPMLNLGHELVVDLFAGGGGASEGIKQALGRDPDVAVNHDPEAIAMHKANHPSTRHYSESVFTVNPVKVTGNQPVGLLWASPDCKHFSKAKGGKPVSKKIRGLAWVVIRWARAVRPRVIMLENVEEFQGWGPVARDGRPCDRRKGQTFQQFIQALERQGYQVEWRELRACDYGAPTIRKRLFIVARRDGLPIVWPQPTHGEPSSPAVKRGKLLPWRTAAECIDWSIPCPSIFTRKRPLVENTMRRIARGVQRYVIEASDPFIVTCNHGGDGFRGQSLRDPMLTLTAARDAHGLVMPHITKFNSGSIGHGLGEPLHTITAAHSATRPGGAAPLGVVATFMAQHNNTSADSRSVDVPLSTITGTGSQQQLVNVHLERSDGNRVSAVRAFLVKYYGNEKDGVAMTEPMHTVPTRDRFGLVTVAGEDYQITDIGMRMLTPRELYRAQGFPDSYIIDLEINGRRLSKSAQVRMCGNSVCPPLAAALARANFTHEKAFQQEAA